MKKTVILIHGYLTTKDDFNKLEKTLINYYDYVVLLDLPGHGKYHRMKDFTVCAVLNYVEKTLEFYLARSSVDVIGYSLGGALARYLCLKYPAISKAVLLAPSNYYFNFSVPFKRHQYIKSATNKQEKKTFKQNLKTNDKIAHYILRHYLLKKFTLKNGVTFCKLIKRINQAPLDSKVKTLIIYGMVDELVPLKSVRFCFNNCSNPQKELVLLDGVGHVLLLGAKNFEIVQKIKQFLNE